MRLNIEHDTGFSVDRSGDADPSRNMRQGFHIYFDGLTVAFEDEEDAEELALATLYRLGYDIQKGEYKRRS